MSKSNIIQIDDNVAIIDDTQHGLVCLAKSHGARTVDAHWGYSRAIRLRVGDDLGTLRQDDDGMRDSGQSCLMIAFDGYDSSRPIINDQGGIARRAGLI